MRALLALAIAAVVPLVLLHVESARAQPREATEPEFSPSRQAPPLRARYWQLGVAFAAEFALGVEFCEGRSCVLGSGGGIIGRVGRVSGPWYVGGALELTKQDASKLYLLAILQQLRAEARRYLATDTDFAPYVEGGFGVATYGDTWAWSAAGPLLSIGGGVDVQGQSGPVLGVSLAYRPVRFFDLQESRPGGSGTSGFAHFVSLTLEVRDRL